LNNRLTGKFLELTRSL